MYISSGTPPRLSGSLPVQKTSAPTSVSLKIETETPTTETFHIYGESDGTSEELAQAVKGLSTAVGLVKGARPYDPIPRVFTFSCRHLEYDRQRLLAQKTATTSLALDTKNFARRHSTKVPQSTQGKENIPPRSLKVKSRAETQLEMRMTAAAELKRCTELVPKGPALMEALGEPKDDKSIFGITIKKQSAHYKAVISAVYDFHRPVEAMNYQPNEIHPDRFRAMLTQLSTNGPKLSAAFEQYMGTKKFTKGDQENPRVVAIKKLKLQVDAARTEIDRVIAAYEDATARARA